MQIGLIQHYIAEFLDDYLKELAQKFPMAPLSSIITNYLYMSTDGTENSRLKVYAANMYNTIKELEQLPDEVAWVPEGDEVLTVRSRAPSSTSFPDGTAMVDIMSGTISAHKNV